MSDEDELEIAAGKKKRRADDQPTNVWSFMLKLGERFGFAAIAAAAAGWMLWTVMTWQREDQRVFLDAVQKNTEAIQTMAGEQRSATDALKKIDTNIQKHLDEEEKAHRR